MKHHLKNLHFHTILLADACLFTASYTGSFLIHNDFILNSVHLNQMVLLLSVIIPSKLLLFYLFGLYRGMWRYTGLPDLWNLLNACIVASCIITAAIIYFFRLDGFSPIIILQDFLLTFLFTTGLRVGIRYKYMLTHKLPRKGGHLIYKAKPHKPKRVLIIGAGSAGEQILREIQFNGRRHYHVVGFLDDDPEKQKCTVHGVPVMGPLMACHRILTSNKIEEVLITIPSASGQKIRSIVKACKVSGVSYKTLPSLAEIINGKVGTYDFRDVDYQDLLGRPAIELDKHEISEYLSDKTIMVTGCGGSIGTELCRQIVRFRPKELLLVDASELNLYKISTELKQEFKFQSIRTILTRVQIADLMENVFKKYSPDVVFHAAAYKHVPMMEVNPWEAIFNNIVASRTVMEMSIAYHVKRFVLVSTDKAVRPTNVMGASKRATELLMQTFQGRGTRFIAVRFGNVVGSSGSVIPLFERQIQYGGPLTVTHPDMTRYFMTIPEAAQLILQAGTMGRGGEIFILNMGRPVKIAEMAKDLIRLSGKEPGTDIDIVYTGLREGEKLYEELISHGENVVATDHNNIMVLRTNGRCNGYAVPNELRSWLNVELEELHQLAIEMNAEAIKNKLKVIVPEYTPQKTGCVL